MTETQRSLNALRQEFTGAKIGEYRLAIWWERQKVQAAVVFADEEKQHFYLKRRGLLLLMYAKTYQFTGAINFSNN